MSKYPITKRSERPYVYEVGGTWGDALHFTVWEEGRVHGWKARRPLVGDLVRIPCKSGKTLIGEFVEVEYTNDPPDMFFGKLEAVGYEGELPFLAEPDKTLPTDKPIAVLKVGPQ